MTTVWWIVFGLMLILLLFSAFKIQQAQGAARLNTLLTNIGEGSFKHSIKHGFTIIVWAIIFVIEAGVAWFSYMSATAPQSNVVSVESKQSTPKLVEEQTPTPPVNQNNNQEQQKIEPQEVKETRQGG